MNNKVKAVIFDMDGVIVDDMEIHKEAWRIFCQNNNLEINENEFQHNFGKTNHDLLQYLYNETLSSREIIRYSNEKEAIFRDIYRGTIEPVAGLLVLLDKLEKTGIKMAVASSAPSENIEFIINALQLQHYFSAIVHADMIKRGKPFPDIFEKAAKNLKTEVSSCIVFEDSPAGIQAAKRAGMTVVGLATSHDPEVIRNADYIIHDFENMALVEGIIFNHLA